MIPPNGKERGLVYTFYSFKGGVGRTMALANVSVLLARWGYSVLVVDWDLEAPGLERFYTLLKSDIQEVRGKTPGIVDLVQAQKNGDTLNWRDCLIPLDVQGSPSKLAFLSAGRSGPDYTARLQSLNFQELFDQKELGFYIEQLRNEWAIEFDFILIDSRTGVTDIGGICTVHLPDILVVLFTTTAASVDGTLYIVERARQAQGRLPLDRGHLLVVPVPTRDESRTEYQRAAEWKKKFADQFREIYSDWLPSGTTADEAVELLRIPYIPYWSFGEPLPVLEEGTSDPASLGRAYEVLARVVGARLDWYAALQGQTLAPPPTAHRRELDKEWVEKQRQAAMEGLSAAGMNGFFEICHFSPDASISKRQDELLEAARQSQLHRRGVGIGIVLDKREYHPVPVKDGIIAHASVDTSPLLGPPGRVFTHWALNKNGDFYCLISYVEDHLEGNRLQQVIATNPRVNDATEALLHCGNLYKHLGAEPNARIDFMARFGGLRNRTLTSSGNPKSLIEDELDVPPLSFTLSAIDSEIVNLVKNLCEPLFLLFGFATFRDEFYQQIVNNFIQGKLS